MGLLGRLFGTKREVIRAPNFDPGSKAVERSAAMLRESIDLGGAGPDGPNRGRLAKPFARGYVFGFSDACIQRFGVLDELESLALITVVHGKVFGHKVGSLLVHDALRDQDDAEFARGRIAGAKDLFRWLDKRSYTPRLLTDYLRADDAPSRLMAPTGESPEESDIETANIPARQAPNAMIIRLPTGRHLKTVKPIEH
jgi:hypothetical protein